jgi:molecular chaperone GrpE (heat shock protein)
MTNRPPPTLAKWPFILTDVVILVGVAWLIRYVLPPKTTLDYLAMLTFIVLWMIASWYSILPWIKEYQAQTKFVESESLTSAVEQISRLEEVGARVQTATASWQSAQDAAVRVTNVAREIEERIKADSKDFMEFAERVSNEEKQHLRLEIDKLRRAEAEWLQVSARMLDHTFALTAAALRSGQPNLATQMTNFQNACREAARRVGLVAFHPAAGDLFDDRSQQLEDANAKPAEGSVVSDILATGYTFQGQLLRKALVRLSNSPGSPQPEPQQQEPAPAPPEPLENEKSQIEQAQAALAEVAEKVHEQRREDIEDAPERTSAAGNEAISPNSERNEVQNETSEQPMPESNAAIADFVVDTYRPTQPSVEEISPSEVVSAGHSLQEEAIAPEEKDLKESFVEASAENAPDAELEDPTNSEPSPDHLEHPAEGRPIEVASVESSNPETTVEEKPRRRQRKTDPQTSLPF